MNLIQKLNSITIDDIKNLKKEQIKEIILGRPEITINILLIAITLYATIFIYSADKNKAKELKNEAVQLKEKLKVVNKSNKLKEEYATFINNFPENINMDELSNKLSEFAVTHNVQILFFTPGGKAKTDFSETTHIKLRISAKNYASVIYFMKEIEESNYNISVERWYGEAVRQASIGDGSSHYSVQIEANIELIMYSLVNA